MGIFHSYDKLPEGKKNDSLIQFIHDVTYDMATKFV